MRKKTPSNNSGASLIEAICSVPIFIICFIVVVDLIRLGSVWGIAEYAAFRGASLLQAGQVEIDTSNSSCIENADQCQGFLEDFEGVIKETTGFAYIIASTSTIKSSAELVAFQHFAYAPQNHMQSYLEAPAPIIRDAYILRPGEKVEAQDAEKPITIDHPTRPFGKETELGKGWPKALQAKDALGTWSHLLTEHPVLVGLRIKFDPIMPLVPAFYINVQRASLLL